MSLVKDTPEMIRGMSALVMIADCGTFSAAGEKLGLTPSAVSKLVSRLETRLRVRLVNRTTRSLQLTDVGASYCLRARQILDDLEGVERDIQSRNPDPTGVLRITAPVLLGNERVLPIVLGFARQYTDVRVHLDLTDRLVDMLDERIDVGIRITADPPGAMVAKKLDDDRRVLCASPGYLANRGTPRTPDDLAAHDCIVFVSGRQPPSCWKLRTKAPGSETRMVPIAGRLHINNTLAMREAAANGFGIADLPHYLVKDDLRKKQLVSVLPDFVVVERSVFAVYVPSRFIPAKIRFVVKALEQGFREKLD
ncbi:MAG: hypothetical protein QOI66_3267 [Myxococcales bacterium]|jgi:DNA-binding transcriptional LysR family regulator|nr:hypothetical protein [Myxococcales bacterium]